MATSERDVQALELRRAGVTVAAIQERLKFRTRAQAESAIVRALGEAAPSTSPREIRLLELDRLDRLQQAMWVRAVKGDEAAVDRVLSLAQARLRVAAMDETAGDTPMLLAYDATVAALGDSVTEKDAAVVAMGRRLAARIDAAAGSLDPTTDTKALYLTPHLMNVLTLLGATPAARAAVVGSGAGADPTPKQAQKSDLEAWRERRSSGA